MGKAILYCFKCSSILREDDFAQRKAIRLGDHVACSTCVPEAQASPHRGSRHSTSSQAKVQPSRSVHPSPSTRRVAQPLPAKRRQIYLVGGGAVGILILLILVAVVASGKKEGGVSVQPPQEAVQPSPPVDPAKSALDTARRFARDHPQDWAGQRREFEKVALDWEKTAAGGEALREADRVKKAILSQVDRAMQDLEKELQGPLEKNDFARAIAVVDGARKRLETPDWELGLVKREREIRELRTQHEEKKAEGLVGHWRLSEGEGTTLTDASGNAKSAKIVGAVSWIRENEANALHFDGRGGHVELPSTPALDQVQDGSYTLAAWFKPDDIPQGEGTANDGAYAVLMKPGYHTGIRYGAGGKFVMEQWLNPEKAQWTGAGTWDTSFPPGSFYHVVGILNRDAGTITLWVNGTLRSSAPCPGNVPSVSFGHSPWRVGIAAPGATSYAWGAKGTVQEVRIYSRALGADEVQALYKARGGN